MSKHKPLIDESGEVRELTAADLRRFKPAADTLPADLQAQLKEMNRMADVRGPEKAPTNQA